MGKGSIFSPLNHGPALKPLKARLGCFKTKLLTGAPPLPNPSMEGLPTETWGGRGSRSVRPVQPWGLQRLEDEGPREERAEVCMPRWASCPRTTQGTPVAAHSQLRERTGRAPPSLDWGHAWVEGPLLKPGCAELEATTPQATGRLCSETQGGRRADLKGFRVQTWTLMGASDRFLSDPCPFPSTQPPGNP